MCCLLYLVYQSLNLSGWNLKVLFLNECCSTYSYFVMHIKIGVPCGNSLPICSNCSLFGLTENKDCPQPGYEPEILGYLLRRLNISYTTVAVNGYGMYTNGSWTGGLGDILNRRIDTMVSTAIVTDLRTLYFDITHPILFREYIFVYNRLDNSFLVNFRNIFRPFEIRVWLCFVAVFAILLITWVLMDVRYKNKIQTSVRNFFRTLFNQHERIFAPKKFLFLSCSLIIIIFSSLYENVLLLNVIDSKETILLSSFSDLTRLLKTNRVKIVTDDDTWAFFESLKYDKKREEFLKLAKAITNPTDQIHLVKDQTEVASHLKTGKYVYPTFIDEGSTLLRAHCELAYVAIENIDERLGYVFTKNSSLTPIMNDLISSSWQTINYYVDKYLTDKKLVCRKQIDKVQKINISLSNIVGPIFLIATGLTIAFVIFGVEIVRTWEIS